MRRWELRVLQATVGVGSLVPIAAGAAGVIRGMAAFGGGAPEADSHFRYLSGLLLGVGLSYVASIHHIERHEHRIWLLSGLVALGGVCRLLAALSQNFFTPEIVGALAMELVVAPLIAGWTARCARQRSRPSDTATARR
jgi:hypothetical protein